MVLIIQIFYIILFFVDWRISYLKFNKHLSAITLFGFCWCILPFISTFGLNNLHVPSIHAHIYVLLGNLVFTIVYFNTINKATFNSHILTKKNSVGCIRNKTLKAFNFLAFLLLIPAAVSSFKTALAYGFNYLRMHASTALTNSTLLQIFYNWFFIPFILSSSCLIISDFVLLRKRPDRILFLLVLTNITVHSIIFAARALIVKVIMYIFFALFFSGHRSMKLMSKKTKLTLVGSIIIMLLFTLYLTSGRMEEHYSDYSFIDSIVMYYVGPFSLISLYLENPNLFLLGDASNYLYGRATFGFITNLFDAFKYFISGIRNYQGSDFLIEDITKYFYEVGDGIYLNSATTSIYPFLRDFGVLGILVGFSFIAFVIAKVETRDKTKVSIRNRAIYIYLLYVLFKTPMNYEPVAPAVFIAILFIFIFSKGGRRSDNIKVFL